MQNDHAITHTRRVGKEKHVPTYLIELLALVYGGNLGEVGTIVARHTHMQEVYEETIYIGYE